jgi:hypothetical protein
MTSDNIIEIGLDSTEESIIQKLEYKLKNLNLSINKIRFREKINDSTYDNYNYLYLLNTKFNNYYNLFDLVINICVFKKDNISLESANMDIKHIKILKKYNYDILPIINYYVNNNKISKIKLILEVYQFNELKKYLLNIFPDSKYLIALYVSKGYKFTDDDLEKIDIDFLEYIAEHSAEEWINNRSCRVCYKKLSVDTTPNLCVDCEKEYVKIEKLKLVTEKLKEKNMVERF